MPTFGKLRRCGEMGGIARLAATFGPSSEDFNLGRRETRRIQKDPSGGVWLPGRHFAVSRHLMKEIRSPGRVSVCQEREGPDLARSMTAHAMLPEDRHHVFGECDLLSRDPNNTDGRAGRESMLADTSRSKSGSTLGGSESRS